MNTLCLWHAVADAARTQQLKGMEKYDFALQLVDVNGLLAVKPLANLPRWYRLKRIHAVYL